MRQLIFVGLIMLWSSVSHAQGIDFTTPILELNGKPSMVKGTDGKEEVLTLGTVTCNALGAAYQDEQQLSGTKRIERYALCMKIQTEKVVELTSEQKMLLVNRDTGGLIGKAYLGSIVYPQAVAIIDPSPLVK